MKKNKILIIIKRKKENKINKILKKLLISILFEIVNI